MECIYHFVSVGSVLLLNGSFVQSAVSVRYNADEPLFVTVLPLDAAYLPYTAELLNGKAVTNQSLAVCCDMGDGHYYVELKPRGAYVYSPQTRTVPIYSDAVSQFLGFVQNKNYAAARSMMSGELSESVSDDALADFFNDVLYIRENIFTPQKGYLLIKQDGTAPRCEIEIKNGLIENIVI